MNCYKCGSPDKLRPIAPKRLARGFKSSYRCDPCTYAIQKAYYDKVRVAVLAHYGNKCACCSESEPLFLTIDHIDNDGHLELGGKGNRLSGVTFYAKIIKWGYPDKYQLLCMNCNFGKRMNNGICPHKI